MNDIENIGPTYVSKKKVVFLFKSPKENGVDKFLEILEDNGFSSISVPVLSFRFVNQSLLKSHMATIHLFSAIIFTSVRSVEAVANVVKEAISAQSISQIRTFVVGQTTAEAARKLGFNPSGETSGNAQDLAKFIVHEAGTEESKPMLYPCSSLHRDTLPEKLTENGLKVTEIVSYETCPNERLKDATQEALQSKGMPDFCVFFSPSGFHFVLSELDNARLPLEKLKIIALGPATHKSICDCGYTPYGMAEKPDPESLLKLLL